MKRICIILIAILLFNSMCTFFAVAEEGTLVINLKEATDEELTEAIAQIQAEQRSRISTTISLDETEITINKGKTQKISANIKDLADGVTAGKYTWATSDDKVATCDKNGMIRAVGAGKAVIKCSCDLSDGVSITADCAVTVQVPVQGMKVQTNKIEVMASDLFVPEITFTPADATNIAVSFSSSDDKIVKVNENGQLEAVSAGKATVTASTTDGSGKSVKINVTVTRRIGKYDDELRFQGLEWGSDVETCVAKLKEIDFVDTSDYEPYCDWFSYIYCWPKDELLFSSYDWAFLPVIFQDKQVGAPTLHVDAGKTIVGFSPRQTRLCFLNGITESGKVDKNITELIGVYIDFDNLHEAGYDIFTTLLTKLEAQYGECTRYIHHEFNKYEPEAYKEIKNQMEGATVYKTNELGKDIHLSVEAICTLHGKNNTGIMLSLSQGGYVTLYYGKLDARDRIEAIQKILEAEPDNTEDVGV